MNLDNPLPKSADEPPVSGQAAKANRLYMAGEFGEARTLYLELASKLGLELFQANILLCDRRMDATSATKSGYKRPVSTVFITDETYLMPTYVAIHSLIRHSRDGQEYDVYVILANVGKGDEDRLASLTAPNVRIHILRSDAHFSKYAITKNGFHVSPTAILKFEIPRLLPHLDKVLYLDGDLLIRSDLLDLYHTDITDAYAAVVEDIKPRLKYKPSILKKLKIEHHRGYFNSGVMLLNLAAMRRDGITQALFDYRENGINFFMDQDALNVVFRDKVKYLSWKDNFLVTLESEFTPAEISREYGDPASYKSFLEMAKAARITHFASKHKPWKGVQSGLAYLWNQYYLSSGAHSGQFKVPHEIFRSAPKHEVIVSLTSYPARIKTVSHTVETLLTQEFPASKVVLWLAQEQFPERERELPPELLSLRERGLSIEWCNDIKSFKKLIPALKRYPESILVTADDDILYKKDWLLGLMASYVREPSAIHCWRAHRVLISDDRAAMPYKTWPRDVRAANAAFENFFTGCGGVLYPPRSLHKLVIEEQLFSQICPHGDDIWFWGMAVLNGTKVRTVDGDKFKLSFVEDTQDVALWKENDVGGRNDIMMANLLRQFPAILERLPIPEAVAA